MANVKIVTYRDMPSLSKERFGMMDTIVSYQVDGKGPYDLIMPKEKLTPQAVEEAVRAAVQTRVAIEGKTFTV